MRMNTAACCPDGWVGGDKKSASIFFNIVYSNKQDVLIPNLVSKVVYGFQIRVTRKLSFKF